MSLFLIAQEVIPEYAWERATYTCLIVFVVIAFLTYSARERKLDREDKAADRKETTDANKQVAAAINRNADNTSDLKDTLGEMRAEMRLHRKTLEPLNPKA